MPRSALIALVLPLLLVPAALGATPRPSVRITDMQPLTLNGAGFKVNERVLVRADYGEETYFRKATTSPEGRFTVTFSRLQVSRCADHDLTVHATGSLGSRFEFTLHHHDCSSR